MNAERSCFTCYWYVLFFYLNVLQTGICKEKVIFAFSASAIMTAPADIIRSDSVSAGRVIHLQDTLRSPGAGWVIARHYPDTLAPMQNVLYEHNPYQLHRFNA